MRTIVDAAGVEGRVSQMVIAEPPMMGTPQPSRAAIVFRSEYGDREIRQAPARCELDSVNDVQLMALLAAR